MDPPIRVRILYNRKHRHAIRLIFGNLFFTSLNKFLLEAKASTCSIMKSQYLLYNERKLFFTLSSHKEAHLVIEIVTLQLSYYPFKIGF